MLKREYLCRSQGLSDELDDLWVVICADNAIDLKIIVEHGGGVAGELESLGVKIEQAFPPPNVVHYDVLVEFVADIVLWDARNIADREIDVEWFLGLVAGQGGEVVDAANDLGCVKK